MNVTIPDLAPLEDILVAEIIEHKHGDCEIVHETLPCSVVAVAWISFKCEAGTPERCCQTTADNALRGIKGLYDCDDCGRMARDCWSVVMFP